MKSESLIILSPGFPKDEGDTTCLPSQQLLVLTMRKLFPQIRLIVLSLHYPYRTEKYNWRGVTVIPFNGKSYKGPLRLFLWFRVYKMLSRISAEHKIIGILSFWCNETALIGNYFARRKRFSHKIWICGQDARKTNAFVKWINPSADQLVAMSDFLQSEFGKNHNILPGSVIYNGVLPTFENLPKDFDVIGAGSLIPLKRYDVFLEIIAELKKDLPAIKVALIGNGPERKFLEKLITKYRLEKNVEMKGEIAHAELMQLMNRSRLLLHPSSYEGYSTVCLEALANGCHVISFTFAENSSVKHWSVAKDKADMIAQAKQVLKLEIDFTPVVERNIEISAQQMISLFKTR